MRLFATGLPPVAIVDQTYAIAASGQYCASGTWADDPAYRGTMTLSTSDPAVSPQTWQYGPNDSGRHTYSYQPKTISAQTVTAADNLGTASASLSANVQPHPVHHIVIDNHMFTPAEAGNFTDVCYINNIGYEVTGNWIGATLYDASNNPTTSQHTFRIVTGDPQGSAPDLTTTTSTLAWGCFHDPPINAVTFGTYGTYTVQIADLDDSSVFTANPETVVVPPPQIQLDILGSGTGSVISNPPGINCSTGTCVMTVSPGQIVSLTAQAAPNSSFSGWGGACSGVAGCTASVGQIVSATFSPSEQGNSPCGALPCGGGTVPSGSWRPYADSSPFNLPIKPTASILPNSGRIVARILGDIAATKQPGNVLIETDGGTGWPTYWGRSGDPVDSITCGGTVDGTTYPPDCDVATMAVHVPSGAKVQGNDPNADADRHMTIIDQVNGTEFDLWRQSESPVGPTAHAIPTVWSGYSSITGTGLALSIKGEGTAARFGNLAGRVRFEELVDAIDAGMPLRHALTIVVNCTATVPIYPADNSNTGRTCVQLTKDPNSDIDAPPMGARIHLKLSLDQIKALKLPEWKKVLLRTMSVYGAIINDTGSNNYFDWQFESGNQYTSVGGSDPWLPWAQGLVQQAAADAGIITDFFPLNDALPDGGVETGYKGLWNTSDDADAGVWIQQNLEIMDGCVSDGGC